MNRAWHYDRIEQFRERFYKGILTEDFLTGEELAIQGKAKYPSFFFEAKREKVRYLIPSKLILEGHMPIEVTDEIKIGVKGKAYIKVNKCRSVKIVPERTMTYTEMISSWMDYEHLEKERFTLWKVITECAYSSRINVKVITFQGWMKDSPLFTLFRLVGYCKSINKPTLAKLKYELKDDTLVLGLNEVQKLKEEKAQDLSSFYEDIGDFKTVWVNPSRGSAGSREMCSTKNLSTLTFFNFPDSKLSVEEQRGQIIDFCPILGHPKIRSRLFPLMFSGGSEDSPACKETFGHVEDDISEEEFQYLRGWIKNFLWYKIHGSNLANQKDYPVKYSIRNNRWNRSYQAICQRLKLLAQDVDQFKYWEELLYRSHMSYVDYIKNFSHSEPMIVKEEFIDRR